MSAGLDQTLPSRVEWIDSARGYCLILVVIGHATRSLLSSGIMTTSFERDLIDTFIYLFHMPALFALSGFVSNDQNKPLLPFISSLLQWIVWPYFLWSTAYIVLQSLFEKISNHHPDSNALFSVLVEPSSLFWFLYVLVVIKIIDRLLCFIVDDGAKSAAVIAAIGLAGDACVEMSGVRVWLIHPICLSLFFYGLGRALRSNPTLGHFVGKLSAISTYSLAAAISFCVSLLGCTAFLVLSQGWSRTAVTPLAGIIGTALVAAMAIISTRTTILHNVRWIGLFAMVIYVQHVIWGTAAKTIVTMAFGRLGWQTYFITMTLAGLAGPIAWQIISQRMNISNFFGIRPVPLTHGVVGRTAIRM
ncbi:acyltransferase family protein [Rhodoplanes sp. Z2-YC6860]|uniref:acyltransferase family protein n=1 Tax=Rhodoplanes sp. Z2-YC6860 TaxID=674703 RepID=UPI00078D4D46|nr:acyltransferase [Rhodoplanes sp. Z2-YC6860]AMN44101.1 acyltransferase family protein [Rhodoplanes sp. Z2-YC6860]